MNAQRIHAPDARVAKYLEEKHLGSVAKSVIVPTSDDDVRRKLRRLGEVAELDGEDRADRRARLQGILVQRKAQSEELSSEEESLSETSGSEADSWSDGPTELLAARQRIAAYAEPRAAALLSSDQDRWRRYEEDKSAFTTAELVKRRRENLTLRQTDLVGTQSGFERAVGSLACYENYVAAGDWSGTVSVLDLSSDMAIIARIAPHNSRGAGASPTCVAWSKVIASGGVDSEIYLHDYTEGQMVQVSRLRGHASRVSHLAFHPLGSFLISASHDTEWRLWDIENGTCLLNQPGCPAPLNVATSHENGSLLLTAGEDAVGRVWDLRSGRCVVSLTGHARSIHAAAWTAGTEAVTGGADNQCLVWDMRNPKHATTAIPAHKSLVTDINIKGSAMATSSMDGTVRLWSCDAWRLQRTLETPTRVLALSASEAGWFSARWDRCIDWYTHTTALT